MVEPAEEVSEERRHVREVIRAWPRPAELATFAITRRGFENSDGGFGLRYLDDEMGTSQRGHVEIYGYWGAPDGYDHQIPERLYLEVLSEYLEVAGLTADAERVRARIAPPR